LQVRAEGQKHPVSDPNTDGLVQKDTAAWRHRFGDLPQTALQILFVKHDFKKQLVRQAGIN